MFGCFVGLLALAGSGCSVSRTAVRETFQGEFRCDGTQIRIERPDKRQRDLYRAVGCNRSADYRCSGDYGELCQRLGEPRTLQPDTGVSAAAAPGRG
jgi:hypothetical protein